MSEYRSCLSCGRELASDANFCSGCGARVMPVAQPAPPAYTPAIGLLRPREGRMIGGVCAAVARHYGWDLALVRILLVVFSCLTSGMGILVYIAAWFLIPDAPYALAAANPQRSAF